jgi:hypothetical protein
MMLKVVAATTGRFRRISAPHMINRRLAALDIERGYIGTADPVKKKVRVHHRHAFLNWDGTNQTDELEPLDS